MEQSTNILTPPPQKNDILYKKPRIVPFYDVEPRCHELPKSPGNTEITKKLTEITTKRTEITGTFFRYMITDFKNVTFNTVSNMLMISSKKM